jgi:hypothetical protein
VVAYALAGTVCLSLRVCFLCSQRSTCKPYFREFMERGTEVDS